MYSLSKAVSEYATHWNDHQWYHDRYCDYVMGPIQRHVYPGDRDAIRVMDQDWDNLVVFDACRYDLFEDIVGTDRFDSYETVWSLGSNTGEWTLRNFRNDDHQTTFGDTVYVTGNISVSRRVSGRNFHDIYNVWETGFNEGIGCVPPDAVLNAAREANETYPNKRLVVHVLQPHCPFITRDGHRYTSDVFEPPNVQRESYVWHDLMKGNVSYEAFMEAYGETLRLGWEIIEPLFDELNGRTVVTADHGNMMGERPWPYVMQVYAHPTRTRPEPLVRVPWGVVEADDRPRITDEGVSKTVDQDIDEGVLQSQLEALGYA